MKKLFHINRVVIENFFSLSILNALNVLLPLITLPYLTRVVGIDKYGLYYYVYTLIQTLIIISSYGFNFSATKIISQNRDNKDYVNRVYNAVIGCKAIISVIIVLVVLSLSCLLLDSSELLLMFVLGLGMLLGDVITPVWLFQGMEKMKYMTIVNSLSKIIFTLLVFIIIRSPHDFTKLMLINSFGYLIAGVLSLWLVYKQFSLRIGLPIISEMKNQIKEGAAVFGTTMGINLYRRINVLILKHFVSDAAVSVYAASEQIIRGFQSLINPLVQAIFPHLSLKFKNRSDNDNIKMIRKISIPFSILLFVLSLGVMLSADIIVQIMTDADFADATLLVRCMVPVIFFGQMNYLLGIVGLINMNRQRYFFHSVLVAGIVSVAFILGFAPKLGNLAAAISMPLSELALFILCIISFLKISKKR